MTGTTARKERTLRPVPTPSGDSDAPPEPGVAPVPPRSNPNAHLEENEPSLRGQKRPRLHRENKHPPENDAQSKASKSSDPRRHVLRSTIKILAWIAAAPLLCVVPLILALQLSVTTYYEKLYDGWVALSIGVVAAMLLVCVFIVAFMLSFGIRRRFFMPFLNAWLAAVLCYSGYTLFHLSASNAKTGKVQEYYTSLHPLLRYAVKNLALVDEQLVITDLHRTPADYRRMGLPPLESSMHFKQSTGFVHAVDIRTKGRSKVENLLVELYFVVMGFETIRHVGTADHLHVSLPLRDTDTLTASSADIKDCTADC